MCGEIIVLYILHLLKLCLFMIMIVCFIETSATQEIVETSTSGLEFVDVGYIYGVHGLQGEISVKPSTDFPELRFTMV